MNKKSTILELSSLLENINNEISLYAQASSFLYSKLNNVNWLGFYLVKNAKLFLGPFQGLPACTEIDFGKGACGRCAQEAKIILIPDVRRETNYIACHTETRSEIVLPIIINNKVIAVLDVDSLNIARFTPDDIVNLSIAIRIIRENLQRIKAQQ